MPYSPTLQSVSKHRVPDWYNDAKFGIFIHWSPSCIPAFAPVHQDMANLLAKHGEEAMFANTPYAEWYPNSLLIPDSPAARHHAKTYGSDYPYDNFAAQFNETIKAWQPSHWGELFERIHARYVVLVTKHHDGFTLFQSKTPNPHKAGWSASRDVVAELTREVRARNLKMGLYYSGLIDWSFYQKPITDFLSLIASGSPNQDYADYVDAHYRELIDKFEPDVLWNDIGYPSRSNVFALFADYYNRIPAGVVNDRWLQIPGWLRVLINWAPTRGLLKWLLARRTKGSGIEPPKPPHSDYATPEYTVKEDISARKWECVRGIGKSFGYNAEERPEDHLGEAELIHMLVDIVSKNGNLLLNIGPMPDGTIPDIQIQRLEALGQWLDVNGEGIFASRPWIIPAATTACGLGVRFTRKDNELFVFFLGKPQSPDVQVPLDDSALNALAGIGVARLLGSETPVRVSLDKDLNVSTTWHDGHAQTIAITVSPTDD